MVRWWCRGGIEILTAQLYMATGMVAARRMTRSGTPTVMRVTIVRYNRGYVTNHNHRGVCNGSHINHGVNNDNAVCGGFVIAGVTHLGMIGNITHLYG